MVPLELETDSFSLVKMMKGEWEIPWNIRGIIRRIQKIMELELIKVQHTYREGNSLAEFLASWCFSCASTISFNTFMELSMRAKAITLQAKQQIPTS